MADITPRKTAKGIVYEARWPNPDLPGKYKTQRFDLKRDAAQHLKDLPKIQEAEAAKKAANASPTIKQCLKAWLVAAETTGTNGNDPVQDETLRHYKIEARHFDELLLIGADGEPDPQKRVADIRLGELDSQACQNIRKALLLKMTRLNAQRVFSRLAFALLEAVRSGDIKWSPMQGVSIKIDSRHKEPPAIPQEYEIALVLKAAKELEESDDLHISPYWVRYGLMLRLLIQTGMRPSEIRGLPRKAVNLDFPMITIMQKAEERGKISVPKTAAGRRDIRLDNGVWNDLLDWLDKSVPKDGDALVFGTESGKPQSHTNITSTMWYKVQIRAGLTKVVTDEDGTKRTVPKYNLYSLRHFYASIQIALGANHKELQKALGHEKVQITLDTYGHLFDRRDGGGAQARAEAMAKLLSGDLLEQEEAKVITFRRAS